MLKFERQLLLFVSFLLSCLGVLFVYESSTTESFALDGTAVHFALTQLLGFGVGVLCCALATFIAPRWYLRYPYLLYLLGLGVICLCFWNGIPPFLVGNRVINNARRWVWLFGFSVQVSELTKFCILAFFAYLLPKVQDYRVFLLYLLPPAVLIILQHDLGTLIVILMMSFGLFFLSGARLNRLLPLGILGVVGVLAFVLLTGYRTARLTCWLNPQSDAQGECYHVRQMQIAIGRGGITGQGINGSIQKYYYIPEASSDSIFAIVSEEVGFLGVTILLGLYVFFLYLIWRISEKSNLSQNERMLGYGIFLLFLCQTFINLGAISGLIPLTGLTLPFFSAGGSSLVISWFLVGVVCALSRQESRVQLKPRRYA